VDGNAFKLTNTLATFQRLMNKILRMYLVNFAMVYLDDILIYNIIVLYC
jgi:hypothetical protein